MPAAKKIKLTPAKGRPMLHWIGKKPLTHLPVFSAQHIESFDPENENTGWQLPPELLLLSKSSTCLARNSS